MTPFQAIEVAKKYYVHVELRREANRDNDKNKLMHSQGAMRMAEEIFDTCGDTHGFRDMKHALDCEQALGRTIRMVETPDDIPQYYVCVNCQQKRVVVRPKLINMIPMVQTVCVGCGELISEEER